MYKKKYLKYKTKYNYIKNQLGGNVRDLINQFEKSSKKPDKKLVVKPVVESYVKPEELVVKPEEPVVKPEEKNPITGNGFETNIIKTGIRVVSLSDIHGDIHSFIISLRDCAQVIKKKEGFDISNTDEDMEQQLKKDVNTDDLKVHYIDDLNYEWCGDNTHVVICGDIIDPYRGEPYLPICRKIEKKEGYEDEDYEKEDDVTYEEIEEDEKLLPCEYYPQIELKILWFINAINKQIINQKLEGKIIKLVGNHDLSAIIDGAYTDIYAFPTDLKKTNYYNNCKRKDIFKVGKPGFNFLVEGGIGILVKINSTIFVHGDLVETYNTYNDLNQFMNDDKKREQYKWQNMFSRELDYNIAAMGHEKSSLLSRKRGNIDNKAHYRIEYEDEQQKYCNELRESFLKFRDYSNPVLTDDVNNLKLVIGHCVQRSEPNEYYKNRTYKLISDETTKIVETYGVETYVGKSYKTNRSTIFGITMECKIEDKYKNTELQIYDLYQLYRIDIGSSRGQDFEPYNSIKTPEDENFYLYSKTPQILEINKDGTVKIKKSTIGNTRRYLLRPTYEKLTENIDELKLTNTLTYNKKYLKYKNKYLQLKQIIKNI